MPRLASREVGEVAMVSTGIARITGLPGVGFEELVRFANGMHGIAFDIDPEGVGVVLLGDYAQVHAGGRGRAHRPGHGCPGRG